MRVDVVPEAEMPAYSKGMPMKGTVVAIGLVAAALALAIAWKLTSTAVDSNAARKTFGAIDIGFAQSMAQHHDQAILMSQIVMAKASSRLGRLAIAIQTKQLIEVGHMQAWLRLAEQPLLPRSNEMDWMLLGPAPLDPALSDYLAACRAAGGAMPGMASTDQLNALRTQQGEDADRLFIDMMIRHHVGALPMALFASKHAETPQVRALATSMRLEQYREIHYLNGLLLQRLSPQS